MFNETFESKLKTTSGNFTNNDQLKECLYSYTSPDKLNSDITNCILEASAQGIPRGCRKNYKPFWNEEIEDAMSRRETARKVLEDQNNDANKINFNKACAQVRKTINLAKRNTWAVKTGNLN